MEKRYALDYDILETKTNSFPWNRSSILCSTSSLTTKSARITLNSTHSGTNLEKNMKVSSRKDIRGKASCPTVINSVVGVYRGMKLGGSLVRQQRSDVHFTQALVRSLVVDQWQQEQIFGQS
jgi:hypothetical protein